MWWLDPGKELLQAVSILENLVPENPVAKAKATYTEYDIDAP